MLVFEEKGKPEKNLSEQIKGENQQQTQPTYGVNHIDSPFALSRSVFCN